MAAEEEKEEEGGSFWRPRAQRREEGNVGADARLLRSGPGRSVTGGRCVEGVPLKSFLNLYS